MESYRRVKGYEFEFIDQGADDRFYQCRGDVYYDDDHDEIPEPGLWEAALELEQQLKEQDKRIRRLSNDQKLDRNTITGAVNR